MTGSIRSARPDDQVRVLEILEAAGLPIEGVAEHFGSFLVVEAGGRVVGAAGVEYRGSSALLRSVVVAEVVRGTGFGSALTRRALEVARSRGVTDVYLLTTSAEGFFERLGFERVARESAPAGVRESVEFRGACPASAIAMRLARTPGREDEA